jgi:hypothetical protein
MARVIAQRIRRGYSPQWAALAWLTVGLFMLLTLTGCRSSVATEAGATATAPAATISGSVQGPQSVGRIVEVVNVDTNERQKVNTNQTGRFTFRVTPGKYRVEVRLRDGEALVKQPGVMNVSRTDIDARADFLIGSTPASRPRGPAYRLDDGLGSPKA